MNGIARWRQNLFKAGWCLLIADAVALPLAGARSPHLRATRGYDELSFWIFGGVILALLSLFLLMFGSRWKRVALAVCALVELFLWIGYAALMVQLT